MIVTEDDLTNELYLNDGEGFFTDASDRLPVEGRSNAALVADLDGDGAADILIGNNGQNNLLLNDGDGFFVDATDRLPTRRDITQDIELGDIDGDLDLLVGNEGANQLLLNDGNGFFAADQPDRLPLRADTEETREADLGDADGDGDLDIYLANVVLFNRNGTLSPQNRLLLNDGGGFFTDVTAAQLPQDQGNSFDGDFIDLDQDGDLDLITANALPSDLYRAYLNDGSGTFTEETAALLPPGLAGEGFDIEAANFNQDGRLDLFLCSRGGMDRLLHGRRRATAVEGTTALGPEQLSLEQNVPNPFNSDTVIRFTLPVASRIRLSLYNLAGQQAATLAEGFHPSGLYSVRWGGRNYSGQELASGLYIYSLQVGRRAETRKLLLLR
ncbi:MAG: T9SS type A sorting domain-containing protein [Candidatus Latescibacteria bacterium]|nr:T9SS type A sorting domain-containing protein [Candidatus Latescibacterota bacterium]